ncbi:MAG: ABC transporter ATP-binding protein [Gammaproteobacteria bacterium]|nr:ABC transporter ATP-binding protein [Gammaproteobacteria bacterium]
MTPDLEAVGLSKTFADFQAVKNVSFTVPAGSFFSILGPSGCGKTTIMRMIAGFLEPSSGDIRIKGESVLGVAPNKRPVNMVFQHLALFPMMNIADNIGYGLRRQKRPKAEIARKVDEVLERIGLPGIGQRKVDELSGGQKQRVAIARCMVLEPDVLLLDEPLGALDLKLREHMKLELKALQEAFETTFIYITHDQSEALVMSDQIAVMNQGRFEQVGTGKDLYYRPQTSFVAGFIGDSNCWEGKVESVDATSTLVRLDNGSAIHGVFDDRTSHVGDSVDIFVRPESIGISRNASDFLDCENRLSGQVHDVIFNGAASRVMLRDSQGGTMIEVALPQSGGSTDLLKGESVHIGWRAAQSTCFVKGAV